MGEPHGFPDKAIVDKIQKSAVENDLGWEDGHLHFTGGKGKNRCGHCLVVYEVYVLASLFPLK